MKLIPLSGALVATSLLGGASHADPVVKLSGFVNGSLAYKFTPEAEAEKGLSLGLDQVELDVAEPGERGLRLGPVVGVPRVVGDGEEVVVHAATGRSSLAVWAEPIAMDSRSTFVETESSPSDRMAW